MAEPSGVIRVGWDAPARDRDLQLWRLKTRAWGPEGAIVSCKKFETRRKWTACPATAAQADVAKAERQIGRWRWDRSYKIPRWTCRKAVIQVTLSLLVVEMILPHSFISLSFHLHFRTLSLLYIAPSHTLSLPHFIFPSLFPSLEREHPKPIVFGDWLGSLFLLRLRFSLLSVSAVFKVCFSISTDLISIFFAEVIDFVPLMRFYLVLDLICENDEFLCRSVADLANRSVWLRRSSLILFVVISSSRSGIFGVIYCERGEI